MVKRLAEQLHEQPLLDIYQKMASETAIYPGRGEFLGLNYCALKLAGEAGEVAEKVGKIIRDNFELTQKSPREWPTSIREAFKKELGDVMWYLANAAGELGYWFQDVGETNLEKLQDRKERGVLSGSGDNR